MNDIQQELEKLAFEKMKDVANRREEILTAFIAKYGCQPDDLILYEQPSMNRFWVEKKNPWTSVKDRIPTDNEEYLTCCSWGIISMDYFLPSLKEFNRDSVTHWMPLPNPPEKPNE